MMCRSGGTSQSLSDGRGALQAAIDLAKTATPWKARVTRLLGRATQTFSPIKTAQQFNEQFNGVTAVQRGHSETESREQFNGVTAVQRGRNGVTGSKRSHGVTNGVTGSQQFETESRGHSSSTEQFNGSQQLGGGAVQQGHEQFNRVTAQQFNGVTAASRRSAEPQARR
jgi:hypothetical protein